MSGLHAVVVPGALLVALTVDRLLGEPPAWLHPVVGMGRYLGWIGQRLLGLEPIAAFFAGALAWLVGAGLVATMGWGLQACLWQAIETSASAAGALITALALGVLLKPMLAWRMLNNEVQAVEKALTAGIDEGRRQVARLASRDTSTLAEGQVRETAIETLAENLNDSVIAPLFWFAVAGLPGAALYRFANTADAMWGYRGRWEWAGKWSARADDALSWLPARVTALALLPRPSRWCALAHEARRTPSPNGGWPMGAMALALGVVLRKPGAYALNERGRPAVADDTPRAIRRSRRALSLCVAAMCTLAFMLRVPL